MYGIHADSLKERSKPAREGKHHGQTSIRIYYKIEVAAQ
jgi:hypothetical protein